jgi:plastocyanin
VGKPYPLPPGTRRVRRTFLALALLALPLAGCTGPADAGKSFEGGIGMDGVRFLPANFTAKVGQPVTWKNTGELAHTVTASDGSFDSGHMLPGAVFQRTFEAPGSYAYYCKPHASRTGDGTWQGMTGVIVVEAA